MEQINNNICEVVMIVMVENKLGLGSREYKWDGFL